VRGGPGGTCAGRAVPGGCVAMSRPAHGPAKLQCLICNCPSGPDHLCWCICRHGMEALTCTSLQGKQACRVQVLKLRLVINSSTTPVSG
jgi:hypothetical protein